MTSDRNAFGGKNPNGLYVPMSEIEQEFVSRLVESGDLIVRIHGWGVVPNPTVKIGDLQVVIPLTLKFDRPDIPIPVHYFDLELLTGSGISLYREKQSCEYDGKPLSVSAGTIIQMVWHIGIRAMDSKLIKALMPGVVGLTSRRFDRDTGDLTLTGNMALDATQKKLIEIVTKGEDNVRAERDEKISPR
jgi:hypothetical protein